MPNHRRLECLLLLALLFAETVGLFAWGANRNFITYRRDFGETFLAHRQSTQLASTAGRFGLLEVNLSSSGKQAVYTHNVNIGTLYFFFLDLVGISSLRSSTIAVFPIFLLGLFSGYVAIKALTQSTAISLTFVTLMVLDFANVGAFAFNALRAWHYLALFSCVYGGHLLAEAKEHRSFVCGIVILFLGSVASFGCGYDFYAISFLVTFLEMLVFFGWRRIILNGRWVVITFALPFLLRQVEVIYWMGFNTWYIDLRTTFAIKVPFASRFISIPTVDEINKIYDKLGLFRPPAYPSSTWTEIWQTAGPLIRFEVIPNFGLIACVLVLLLALCGLISFVWRKHGWTYSYALRVVLVYFLGALLGLLLFSPFSLHVYMKHDFPLIAALIHLAEAICIVILFDLALRQFTIGKYFRAFTAFVICVAICANAIAVRINNGLHSKELDFGWLTQMSPAKETPDSNFKTVVAAVAEPPESRPILKLENCADVTPPDKAPWLLAKAEGLLVDDPIVDVEQITHNHDKLIYAPGDGWCNLDAREPDLSNRDWLLSLISRQWNNWGPTSSASIPRPYLISGHVDPIHPGDILHLAYFLSEFGGDRYTIYHPALLVTTSDHRLFKFDNLMDCILRNRKGGAVSMIYNAKFRIVDLYFLPPIEVLEPYESKLNLRIVLSSENHVTSSENVEVLVSDLAKPKKLIPVLPEPTTQELVAAFSSYPLLKESNIGVGYAVLDLRHRK